MNRGRTKLNVIQDNIDLLQIVAGIHYKNLRRYIRSWFLDLWIVHHILLILSAKRMYRTLLAIGTQFGQSRRLEKQKYTAIPFWEPAGTNRPDDFGKFSRTITPNNWQALKNNSCPCKNCSTTDFTLPPEVKIELAASVWKSIWFMSGKWK